MRLFLSLTTKLDQKRAHLWWAAREISSILSVLNQKQYMYINPLSTSPLSPLASFPSTPPWIYTQARKSTEPVTPSKIGEGGGVQLLPVTPTHFFENARKVGDPLLRPLLLRAAARGGAHLRW